MGRQRFDEIKEDGPYPSVCKTYNLKSALGLAMLAIGFIATDESPAFQRECRQARSLIKELREELTNNRIYQ